jgi:hypothetical protein
MSRKWPDLALGNRSKTRGGIRHRRACRGDDDQEVPDYRDGRDKPGHDRVGTVTTFASLTYSGSKRTASIGRLALYC